MAYLRNFDDEENQKQDDQKAPGSFASGGGWFTPGPSGGAFAQGGQPTATPQQQRGSGSFTNFQSWLDAGKGRDKSISDQGSGALGSAKSSFRTTADNAWTSVNGAAPAETFSNDDVQTLVGKEGRGEGAGGEYINGVWVPDNLGKTSAKDRLIHGVTQRFGGPAAIDWDPTVSSDVRKVDALSGADTAGAQLAGDAPYSGGARNLDEALFRGDSASQQAIAANKANANQFLADTSKEQADYQGKASGVADSYAKANAANRGAMQGLFNWIGGEAQKQQAANAKGEAARAATKPREGYAGTYAAGNTPTLENSISGEQAGWMKTLGDVLGIKGIEKKGSYTPGTWSEEQQVNVNAGQPSDQWQAAENAATAGKPVGEVGGQQSIIKPGQVGYYVDQSGNYVDKASGKVNATAAQMQQLSDALKSGEVTAAGGLDAWLKAHNMNNPFGGSQ